MMIDIECIKLSDKFDFSNKLISFDEYIDKALFDSKNGYYLKKSSITEDFITPSTLNENYIESLISFIRSFQCENFIEIGIGDGQFSNKYIEAQTSQNIYLIERSENKFAKIKKSNQKKAHYLRALQSFEGNSFFFLQELFDCFPSSYFVYQDKLIYEKKINIETLAIEEVLSENELIKKYALKLKSKTDRDFFQFLDYSRQISFLKNIYESIQEGWILIIDYGYRQKELLQANQLVDNLFRAYQHHQQIKNFIHMAGDVDITYDLDFDILMESWVDFGGTVFYYGTLADFLISKTDFLNNSNSLKNRYYLDSRLMGEAFKVVLLKK